MNEKISLKRKDGSGWWTPAVLLAALIVFIIARVMVFPETETLQHAQDYAEYESGVVVQILTDSTEPDGGPDGSYRGEQILLIDVLSGQYQGESMMVNHYVGPLYGVPLMKGDRCTILISTYEDGKHTATVYEYDRSTGAAAVVMVFFLVTLLVGGKTGAKSLFGLGFTVLCVFLLLFPALMKGAPTLPATVAVCAYAAVVSFVVLGGVTKKTVCAFTSTIAGLIIALIFTLAAQMVLRIDGLRLPDVEPLLQLQQTGTPIRLAGLLSAGVIICSLGAVMDVTMSLSSAAAELHSVNPAMDSVSLFRSGMNIGRDMVGTMANTLILAMAGGCFAEILYIYSLGLSFRQLLSSAWLSVELISAAAGSTGVILSVPITAWIASIAYGTKIIPGGGKDGEKQV